MNLSTAYQKTISNICIEITMFRLFEKLGTIPLVHFLDTTGKKPLMA